MKRLFQLFCLSLALLVVSGCEVNASKVDASQAKKFASTLTYIKDARTGLCFAMVASRKTGDTDQNGLGLTEIDCEKVAAFLVDI